MPIGSCGDIIFIVASFVSPNKNIIIPNSKCLYTEVKTEKGWEKKETGEALNKSFKNSAKNLYNSKQSIESTNPKVFAVKQNTIRYKDNSKLSLSYKNWKNLINKHF